jgi:hypothetical protein
MKKISVWSCLEISMQEKSNIRKKKIVKGGGTV